jgi:hypothetical protein
METIVINRYITAAILVTTLSCSQLAIAKLIRVSDSGQVDVLASETSTVWEIDNDSGKLQGAFNVDVGGTLWDVVFRDGTFTSLFNDAEAATIAVRTEGEATDLSEALLASVFVDGRDDDFWFDSLPALTGGCNNTIYCVAVTAYGPEKSRGRETHRGAMGAYNGEREKDDEAFRGFQFISDDTTQWDGGVYALWTVANQTQVPAPSTISIFALGLIGLAARRFKKQSCVSFFIKINHRRRYA